MQRLLLLISAVSLPIVGAVAQVPPAGEVLAALNVARANPAAYAASLARYRIYYRGKIVRLPGDPIKHRTIEGAGPLDEAIAYLRGLPALSLVTRATALTRAAADHVADQGASGATGHYSADGTGPFERILAHGGGGSVAEVIAYGSGNAPDVIRQLIVDDGVANREHRRILLDPGLRLAGAACGTHTLYRSVCVIDFATQTGPSIGKVK